MTNIKLQPLAIFVKSSILDVWQGSQNTSVGTQFKSLKHYGVLISLIRTMVNKGRGQNFIFVVVVDIILRIHVLVSRFKALAFHQLMKI